MVYVRYPLLAKAYRRSLLVVAEVVGRREWRGAWQVAAGSHRLRFLLQGRQLEQEMLGGKTHTGRKVGAGRTGTSTPWTTEMGTWAGIVADRSAGIRD